MDTLRQGSAGERATEADIDPREASSMSRKGLATAIKNRDEPPVGSHLEGNGSAPTESELLNIRLEELGMPVGFQQKVLEVIERHGGAISRRRLFYDIFGRNIELDTFDIAYKEAIGVLQEARVISYDAKTRLARKSEVPADTTHNIERVRREKLKLIGRLRRSQIIAYLLLESHNGVFKREEDICKHLETVLALNTQAVQRSINNLEAAALLTIGYGFRNEERIITSLGLNIEAIEWAMVSGALVEVPNPYIPDWVQIRNGKIHITSAEPKGYPNKTGFSAPSPQTAETWPVTSTIEPHSPPPVSKKPTKLEKDSLLPGQAKRLAKFAEVKGPRKIYREDDQDESPEIPTFNEHGRHNQGKHISGQRTRPKRGFLE